MNWEPRFDARSRLRSSTMKTMPRLLAVAVFGCAVMGSRSVCAQSWTQTGAPIADWRAIASSADGSNLVAVSSGAPATQATRNEET